MSGNYKELTILGSTGSIGRQALELARAKGIRVAGLAANKSVTEVERQAREFLPGICVMADHDAAKELGIRLSDTDVKVLAGGSGMDELIGRSNGIVLNAVIGSAGLMPTMRTLEYGKELALANKESLVMAGEHIMNLAKSKGITVRPVDSEHSAIWQSLRSGNKNEIKRLLLTASGGPFFGLKKDALREKTLADALAHPTWKMGRAITIDSATLMNKGFEVIEASHLFGVPAERIKVLVHRQSIIHSMTEYIDNSVIAQLSVPDMRCCINYALTYPARVEGVTPELDLAAVGKLDFAEPDIETFELLGLAYKAICAGGALPAVLHAANEAAVNAFLDGRLPRFTDIQDIVVKVTGKLSYFSERTTFRDILEADATAREEVLSQI